MATEVMAQPADPMVSVVEVPSGAPAQAPSCWPITAMLVELSARAPAWPKSVAATAMAEATSVRRRLPDRRWNFTNRRTLLGGAPNGGHLDAWFRPKQAKGVTQGGRLGRADHGEAKLCGKGWRPRPPPESRVTGYGPSAESSIESR